MIDSMSPQDVEVHQAKLRALTDDFGSVTTKHGFADQNCQPECRDTIVIGPDGLPRHEVVCTMVCV
jgi:hypothetical protein